MAKLLRVEVLDGDCGEDEAFVHHLPLDTDRHDLINAVATLYPSYFSLYIVEVEDK